MFIYQVKMLRTSCGYTSNDVRGIAFVRCAGVRLCMLFVPSGGLFQNCHAASQAAIFLMHARCFEVMDGQQFTYLIPSTNHTNLSVVI
jgi:hypothetical protein